MDPNVPNYEKPPPYSPPTQPTNFQGSYSQYGYPPVNYQHQSPNVNTPLINPTVYPIPKYGGPTTTVQTREIIIVGGCPICRIGVLETEYPCTGILCAILFFPIGLLCCLALREKRCSNCGAQFD